MPGPDTFFHLVQNLVLFHLELTLTDTSAFRFRWQEENPHVAQSVLPPFSSPSRAWVIGRKQGPPCPRELRPHGHPATRLTHTLLSLPVLRPSSKALILWTLQQGPVETSGTPAGRGEVEAPSCHAAFLVDCLGGSCQNSKWKQPPTPFWGSDDSIPTHPG